MISFFSIVFFRRLRSWQAIPGNFKFNSDSLHHAASCIHFPFPFRRFSSNPEPDSISIRHHVPNPNETKAPLPLPRDVETNDDTTMNQRQAAFTVQNLLKSLSDSPDEELGKALGQQCGLLLSEDLVLEVLKLHRSVWNPAFRFFNWASLGDHPTGYSPGPRAFNEVLDTLGRMRRFREMHQVFDEMSKRGGVVNERSFGIVVHRYAAAHRTEDATNMFYRRKEYGFKLDLVAFQTLLMALCRYKHVEAAEFLFHSKRDVYVYDIKTWNIILNGWTVRGNLREVKRFWNEILRSKIRPDRFTYGIFMNSLAKAGKISRAVRLFHAMWEKGCTPDVPICNAVIDGLCFKKRIPEALEIFREMNDKDCQPDVATYNSLIKHLCRIGRREKAYELLGEMEHKMGSLSPNDRTYGYLISSAKNPVEVQGILERMEKNGCRMTGDTYNLLLRLYMGWSCEEEVQSVWSQMERHGLGPDQRSYTIMVHGLHKQGRLDEALNYFNETIAKGFTPEPRTNLLLNAIKIRLKEREARCIGIDSRRNTGYNSRMRTRYK